MSGTVNPDLANTVATVTRIIQALEAKPGALSTGKATVFTAALQPGALPGLLGRAIDGWLMTTDAVYRLDNGEWARVSGADTAPATPVEPATCARTLEAELAVADGVSVRVRRIDGALRSFRYVEAAGEAEPGESSCGPVDVVWRDDRLVSNAPGTGRLRYRTAWRAVPEGAPGATVDVWRPWFSRFTGWETQS